MESAKRLKTSNIRQSHQSTTIGHPKYTLLMVREPLTRMRCSWWCLSFKYLLSMKMNSWSVHARIWENEQSTAAQNSSHAMSQNFSDIVFCCEKQMKTWKSLNFKGLLLTTEKHARRTLDLTYNLLRLWRQLSPFQDVYRMPSNDHTEIFYRES